MVGYLFSLQAYKYFLTITTNKIKLNLCLRGERRFEGKVKSLNRNCDFDMLKCVLWSSLNFNMAWLLKSFMTVHTKNVCSRESGSLQKKHVSSVLILPFLIKFFFVVVTNVR